MQALDLALQAAKIRKSSLTGFVHHPSEAIPLYENFCYALALCRTKTADNVLEAKALLTKLFAFQTADGLPIYLHEYPVCHSPRLHNAKMGLVSHLLLRDFGSVLGEALRGKLHMPLPPPPIPQTPDAWADYLILSQLIPLDLTSALRLWDGEALCYRGAQKQRGGEPEVTLFDLILGEWTGMYPPRALLDTPLHLQASLIFPHSVSLPPPVPSWERRFWKEGSALFHTEGTILEDGVIELSAKEVQDHVESSFFFNRHDLFAKPQATTFQLGETIRIDERFEVSFSVLEGKGQFWGHIHFGNRPGQMLQHEAFDVQVALRTVWRTERCLMKVVWKTI